MVSTDRAAALRNKCLSLAKTCSIGFRSGEYFGRKQSLAPAARLSWRTALALWLRGLSRVTMSPGRGVGDEDLLDIDPEALHPAAPRSCNATLPTASRANWSIGMARWCVSA